jgi:DNA-directed RNA polymerase subunit M/transcription elongation factor TFIIS
MQGGGIAGGSAEHRGAVLGQLLSGFCEGRRAEARELEHAVSCVAAASGAAYRREAFRFLHLAEVHAPRLRAFLTAHGAVASVLAPLASILDRQEAASGSQHAATHECEERLLAYCEQGALELPDAGTQCGRCRSRDIKFEMLQTRSADEPMSIFCTCDRCGKRWRM